ncbi:hypothetical protein AAC387_Pa01g2803 [Persea americana]
MSPFQAMYGRPPPRIDTYVPGSTSVQVVDSALCDRDDILQVLKDNILAAQNRMKVYADQWRMERSFEIKDWVFLRLQPYRQRSMGDRGPYKLSPRFYGPFQVVARVGPVVYKLKLPPESKTHPVFHVSVLKRKLGFNVPARPTLPPVSALGTISWVPSKILDHGIFKHKQRAITKVLV